MFRSKSLQAIERRSIRNWSFSSVGEAMPASSAFSMPLIIIFLTLDFVLSLAGLKNLPSDRVLRKMPPFESPNACVRSNEKKMSKWVRVRTYLCFTSLRMLKGLENFPSNSTVSLIFWWKDLTRLKNFEGQPILESAKYSYSRLTVSNAFVK